MSKVRCEIADAREGVSSTRLNGLMKVYGVMPSSCGHGGHLVIKMGVCPEGVRRFWRQHHVGQ